MSMQVRTGEATAHSAGVYGKALSVCAKKCRVTQVRAFNKGAADIYLQIHDSAAAPSDFTTCRAIITVGADLYGGEGFVGGLPLTNGCYLFASSANNAATAIAGDDVLLMAVYSQERH